MTNPVSKPNSVEPSLQMRVRAMDALLLDPPKYRKLQNWLNGLTLALIILAFIAWFGGKAAAFSDAAMIGLTAALAALAVIALICTFVFAGMRRARFVKFNSSAGLEDFLIAAYERSRRVGGFSSRPDDGPDAMPVLGLRSSRLPKDSQLEKITDRVTVSLANAGRPLTYRVITYYDSVIAQKLNAAAVRKVVIVAIEPVSDQTFYLAQTNLNFGHPNFANVNNMTLSLTESGKNGSWHLYEPDGKTQSISPRLSRRTLAEALFNPRQTSARFDFYNDAEAAYLIAAVPSAFMKATLEAHESISDYAKNMEAQAEIDVTVLMYLAHLRDAVEQHLVLPEGVSEAPLPEVQEEPEPQPE